MKKLFPVILTAVVISFSAALNCRAQNKPAFSIPFQLIDNRPFIAVKIKQHIFHFILDCGANYGLDIKTANALNLKYGSQSEESGAGANTVKVWNVVVDSTQIGPAHLLKAKAIVTDLSQIKNKLHLPYFDGVIGYTFMKNYAVQFDYVNSVVNFYTAYKGATPVEFTYCYGFIPKITAQVDGKPAILIFDTGDRTAFTMLQHFAKSSSLINKYKLSDTSIIGYGLGGPIYARTFTLKQLAFGNKVVVNIPSRIPMLTSGGFADPGIDGSIGGGVLKQYKFTIDYKNQKMYFE